MKTGIAFVIAAFTVAGLSSVSAQSPADEKKYEKGATVILQGCVTAAERKDTWVMTNFREWPVGHSEMGKYGKRYYWIDKSGKDMKAYFGQTIQVIGKISDVSKTEMEFKAGEHGGGMNLEVEIHGARDVVTPAANISTNPGTRPNKDDIKITLLKVKVEEIKMTSATCSATL